MRAGLLCMFLMAATGSQARTYAGDEAAALRCANTLAYTGVALNATGAMGDAEKDVMLGLSIGILENHVSGTWAQKRRALEIVRDRRDVTATLSDFRKIATRCIARFQVN